ncbi:MAG TPA: phosphate ABC transporter permease PstA [Chthoniobacterales bacterium]
MHAPVNIFEEKKSFVLTVERIVFWLFRVATWVILAFAAYIMLTIVIKGAPQVFKITPPFIDVEFLTKPPETLYVFESDGKKMTMGDKEYREYSATHETTNVNSVAHSAGGIFPCIVGTVLLVIGSMAIALFLGVSAAIFLSEYSRPGNFVEGIRLAIMNLAGVPSIVFGLFGFAMFVIFLRWNVSLLAGWFTLAFMVLPVIITATEESLRAVPKGFREGSLALGATKWQTISSNVLPYAMPGILTSSILGIARVAGETAPIMFTAAFVTADDLPWENLSNPLEFFFRGVMALPYHIYVVSSKIPQNEYTERMQYGTAFVFLAVVASIAITSIVLRTRLRKKYKW